MSRACDWCAGPIPTAARRDAITCSQRCRQARHRVVRHVSRPPGEPSRGDRPLQARRLAYADPPYPGKSGYYIGHPDYGGEVDHADLLSRLATYDGWALSTSARALPAVLALAVAQDLPVRVAAWVRGPRPHATARHAVNAWEPVIYVPPRMTLAAYMPVASAGEHDRSAAAADDASRGSNAGAARRVDVLTYGVSPMVTLPTRVIGAKPAAFCRWIFDLINATPADTLDDLYPGSGIVGKCWEVFAGSGQTKGPVRG